MRSMKTKNRSGRKKAMRKENPGVMKVVEDSIVSLPSVIVPLLGGAAFWGVAGLTHHLTDTFVKNEYANPILKVAADVLLAVGGVTLVNTLDESESELQAQLRKAAVGGTAAASFRTLFDLSSVALPTTGVGKTLREWVGLPRTRNLLAPSVQGKSSGVKGAVKSTPNMSIDDANQLLEDAKLAVAGDTDAKKKAGFMGVWVDGQKLLEIITKGYDAAEGPFFYEDENGTKVIAEDDIEVARVSSAAGLEGSEFYYVEEDGVKYILAYTVPDGTAYPFPSLRLTKKNFIDNGKYKWWETTGLFVKGKEASKFIPAASQTTGGYQRWNPSLGQYEVWSEAMGAYLPAVEAHSLAGYEEWSSQLGGMDMMDGYQMWSDSVAGYDPAIEAHSLAGYDPAIEAHSLAGYDPAIQAHSLAGYDPAIEAHSLAGYYDYNPTKIG